MFNIIENKTNKKIEHNIFRFHLKIVKKKYKKINKKIS